MKKKLLFIIPVLLVLFGFLFGQTGRPVKLWDTNSSDVMTLTWNENDTAARAFNITINGADRTFALHGNLTVESASLINQDLTTDSATGQLAGLALTGNLTLAANSITGTTVDINNAELQQLSLIGATTISAAQWGYLGATGAGGGQLMAALTAGESTQLETIGAVTISNAQWAYLGGSDQGFSTGLSPTYVTVKLSGLTDAYIPYHIDDATGLADSVIYTNGTNISIGATFADSLFSVYKANQDLTTDNTAITLVHAGFYTTDANAIDKGAAIGLGGVYAAAGGRTVFGAISGRKANVTVNNADGYLVLYTYNAGLKERVRITSAGNVGINTTTIPHGGVGMAKFAIDGTNASTAGPHIQLTTAASDYPLLQIMPWTHDLININFDCYYDGSWKSSDAGSNFRIFKNADQFKFEVESGIAQGATITWDVTAYIDTSSVWHFNAGVALAATSITGTSVDINNAEMQQLSAIGATTISGTQWGYLGATGAGGGQLMAALTTGESDQLELIGATTISAAQWGYLGATGTGGGQLLAAITTGESTQIEAIGAVTINVTQWGYLGASDQGFSQASAVTFATVDTGQGANELYDMDQHVLQASSPTFGGLTANGSILATTGLIYTQNKIANTTPGYIVFEKQRAAAIVQNNDYVGQLTFSGYDGGNYDSAAWITCSIAGTPSAGTDMPGRMRFWTTPDASATPVSSLQLDPDGKVHLPRIPSTDAGDYDLRYDAADGIVYDTSDIRQKSDIQPLDYGLDEIMQLSPSRYFYKKATNKDGIFTITENGNHTIGLIAQEVFKIIPEAVYKPEDESKNLWGLNEDKLTPVIINAIQEQQAHIESLEARIEQLESLILKENR